MALPQQPGLAVAAPVLEIREGQDDDGEAIEIRLELGDLAVVWPLYAGRRVAAEHLVGVGEKARRRNDDGNAVRDRRIVEHAQIAVLRHPAVLNEWHRHAP